MSTLWTEELGQATVHGITKSQTNCETNGLSHKNRYRNVYSIIQWQIIIIIIKETAKMSINLWMDTQNVVVHSQNWIFGNEKNKVPIHVKIQENPGNILSERSHSQKATNCIILFTRKVQGRQICRNRGKTENKEWQLTCVRFLWGWWDYTKIRQ